MLILAIKDTSHFVKLQSFLSEVNTLFSKSMAGALPVARLQCGGIFHIIVSSKLRSKELG